MSLARFARRTDESQAAIVEAVRKAGWACWVVGWPVDLLCWRADKGFRTLEVKTPHGKAGRARVRSDQAAQNAFVELTGTPRVTTPYEALAALGCVTVKP